MLKWGLLLVEIMKSDWVGAMYKVLGPEGPHQSIRGGKTDCVVNLIERSLTTPDLVCNRPEFEGTKFKSNDTMGFADEEYPGMKRDMLLRLLPDLAVEQTGLV